MTASAAIKKVFVEKLGLQQIIRYPVVDWTGKIHISPEHMNVEEILRLQILSREELKEYTIVCNARNPYDRIVALFIRKFNERRALEEKIARGEHRDPILGRPYRELIEYLNLPMFHDFYDFLKSCVEEKDPYKNRIISNLFYTKDTNTIIRYENKEEDLQKFLLEQGVSDSVELAPQTSPHPQPNWQEFYSNESRKLVQEIVAAEEELFGYSFDGE